MRNASHVPAHSSIVSHGAPASVKRQPCPSLQSPTRGTTSPSMTISTWSGSGGTVSSVNVHSTFAAMVLLYALFSKLAPVISVWELRAGERTP